MAKKNAELQEMLENLRTEWEEMTPSELIIELKTLEDDVAQLFSTLREKRAVLNALRNYIREVAEDDMYDESQND